MSPDESPPAVQVAKKPLVPKTTVPLGKFIRTGEGILVFAFNLAMLIVPIVSSALTPEQAVKWAGIVNGVALVCRTGLKIVAIATNATGTQPADVVGKQVTVDADQLGTALAQIVPKDLATGSSIDDVGSQIDEVKGLVGQLLSDTGVVNAPAVAADSSPGAAAPQAAAPQSAATPSSPPAQPIQSSVSDDQEFANGPTDADIVSSIADTTPNQQQGAGDGQVAQSAGLQAADVVPAPALVNPTLANGGTPPAAQPVQALVSDEEELASAPTGADVLSSIADAQPGDAAAAQVIANPTLPNGGGQPT